MNLLKNQAKYLSICFLILIGCLTSVEAANQKTDWATPIDKSFNFYQMTPFLYRSGMPNSSKVDLIKANNIKTIITFIDKNDSKWLGKQTDINLISYPMHADRVDDDDVLEVLRQIQESQARNEPVLMHCKHGQNRTGIFAAMYRIVIQHWTKEQAIDEMLNNGFADIDDVEDALAYIKEADVKQIRLALADNSCSTSKFDFCKLFTE